jgi:hypothetical protein
LVGGVFIQAFKAVTSGDDGKMPCKVMNERWVGRHLLCDVVLEDLAILGVTVSGSIYGESVKTWMNAAIPEDVRNEIDKAVLVVYHRGSSSCFSKRLCW